MGMGLTLIIILGMIGSFLFAKIRLPGLLGMLIVGIVIGPYGLGLINQSILDISADLRMIALVVIILRAGLGLKRKDIQAIGKPALKMSVIPALFEGLTIAVVSMWLLKFSFIQGGILGFIISAVSPAVIVPLMLKLQDEKLGTNKSIPTLILSAASIDDVFAITLFTSFLSLYMNKSYQVSKQLVAVPLAIILGIAFGLMVGFTIVWLFKRFTINDSKKLLIILSLAIMMTFTEEVLQDYIKIASLLGVMALGFIITDALPHVGKKLSFMFGQVWIGCELFLFVLVGALVDIKLAFSAGALGVLVITLGLLSRCLGVMLSLKKSKLNRNEKLFTLVSFIPKATVQAAIGAIPLSLGILGADVMLAIAVLSIVITAPLGALGIQLLAPKLLVKEDT